MLARRIIDIAKTKLNDEQGKRWPDAELLNDLNDGQRRIMVLDPTTKGRHCVVDLEPGVIQRLPDSVMVMMEPVRNKAADGIGSGRAVIPIDRRTLDNMHPDWPADPPLKEARFIMYDRELTPREFSVYPPQPQSPGALDAVLVDFPTDCTLAELDGEETGKADSEIDLPDDKANALLYFIMFRAHSKDSRYALLGMADRYERLMLSELGLAAQRTDTDNRSASER